MKKNKPIKNIQDVYDLAGSAGVLANKLGVHQVTAEGWRRSGIPTKYWDDICKHYNISPAELFSVSKAARNAILNPSRCK